MVGELYHLGLAAARECREIDLRARVENGVWAGPKTRSLAGSFAELTLSAL